MLKVYIASLLTVCPLAIHAQSQWNYGVSTHYSFENYKQTVTSFPPDQGNSSSRETVRATRAFGGGVWLEKRFHWRLRWQAAFTCLRNPDSNFI